MTSYLYNDYRTKTDTFSTIAAFAAGDIAVFARDALWWSQQSTVLSLAGANKVTISGQLYGSNVIDVAGLYNVITVTGTGVLAGNYGAAISAQDGAGADLYNSGHLSGNQAVDLGLCYIAFNEGTIVGDYNGLVATPLYQMTLTNTGAISGAASAIFLHDGGSFRFDNSGTVSGGAVGFTASDTAGGGIVSNEGSISGDTAVTFASDAPLSFTNSGTLNGGSFGLYASTGDYVASISNSGLIAGDTAIAIASNATFALYNEGEIRGTTAGVKAFAPGFSTGSITNSGTISGDIGITVEATLGDIQDALTITNTGIIAARGSAIFLNLGAYDLTLVNSGTITGTINVAIVGVSTVLNTGSIVGRVYLGGSDDVFDSSAGHLSGGAVSGGYGDDLLIGGVDQDRLLGFYGNDELRGGDGDDTLTGGSGADILNGGAGIDYVAFTDASPYYGVVVDLAAPDLNTRDATGDTFISIEGVKGTGRSDQLYGDDGVNYLYGNGGNDTLDGRAGADVMRGGIGDDLYFVDSTRDRVIELGSGGIDEQGIDSVNSVAARYTLSIYVEKLTLLGTAAISGRGNDAANTLTGNVAANALAGAAGSDTLHGGGGADTFVFDTALDAATNVDAIDDFAVGLDKLQLDRGVFSELNGGAALRAAAFVVGSAAADATDRTVYDAASGNLFYDADGTGAGGQVLFAHLTAGLALTAADFALVG